MSRFGIAAGKTVGEIEAAIEKISSRLAAKPYCFNLIHSPAEPAHEARAWFVPAGDGALGEGDLGTAHAARHEQLLIRPDHPLVAATREQELTAVKRERGLDGVPLQHEGES